MLAPMITGTRLVENVWRRLVVIVISAMGCCSLTSVAAAGEHVTFFGVGLDPETRDADERLRDYLKRSSKEQVDLEFEARESTYQKVIKELVEWDSADGVVMARTTPYVQVAAELLGADLEVLATYVSRDRGTTTYNSYYVVRKELLAGVVRPEPADVIRLISRGIEGRRARFTYHSIFSTSSFFLPSLHLRDNRVFHMPKATDSLSAIEVSRARIDSSSELVRSVARGEADFAAVWDGTLPSFLGSAAAPADAELAQGLAFVKLPSSIPNDLLVCSRSAPEAFKESIRSAIRAMDSEEIGLGDFAYWIDINDATEARAALSKLRHMAEQQVHPVTVDVRAGRGSSSSTAAMVDAARHAVRLSGTEHVLYDDDFHKRIDMVWTLDAIHDGAARLTTSLRDTRIADQVFPALLPV